LVRQARVDSGLSQAELTEKIYRRRATFSNIENGKVVLDTTTIALLAYYLQKPITYFFPASLYRNLKQDELTHLEQELIKLFRRTYILA
jgi:transcriptional regulator with XRE-family HTH domain